VPSARNFESGEFATFGFHTLVDTQYGREESWHRPASPLEGIAVEVAEQGRGGQRAGQRRSGGQRGEHWGQAVSVEVRARGLVWLRQVFTHLPSVEVFGWPFEVEYSALERR